MLEAPLLLGEISANDLKFSKWRRETDLFTGFLQAALEEKEFLPWREKFLPWHYKSQNCGTFLEFKNSSEGLKLNSANFCKHRLCPMCAKRRSHMWGAKISEILPLIPPKQLENCIFQTLTVKNFPLGELPVRKKWLSNSVKRLLQSLRDKELILGYIKGFEITRPHNSFTECHPHYHLVLAMEAKYFDRENYINQTEWRSRWKKAANLDYDPFVHIRAVDSLQSGILETVKYELKPDNYTSSWIWTARLAIANQNTQRVSTGGIFRDHLRSLEYDPDMIHEADRDLGYFPGGSQSRKYLFRWDSRLKHHVYYKEE